MEYFFHAVGTEGKLMYLYLHSHFQPHGNNPSLAPLSCQLSVSWGCVPNSVFCLLTNKESEQWRQAQLCQTA